MNVKHFKCVKKDAREHDLCDIYICAYVLSRSYKEYTNALWLDLLHCNKLSSSGLLILW